MAISPTPVFYPPLNVSAYNPIMWSIISNQIHQYDFKYVIDIQLAAFDNINYVPPIVTRIKITPNQSGVGMFDISSIVQGYIDYSKYSNEEGNPSMFKSSKYITGNTRIICGEEYRIGPNGPLVLYNGQGSPGNPSVIIGTFFQGQYTYTVTIIPSSLNHNDQTNLLTAGTASVYLSEYLGVEYYTPPFNGKFLKRDSNVIEVGINDRHTLTQISAGNQPFYGSYNNCNDMYAVNYFDSSQVIILSQTFSFTSTPSYSYEYIMPSFRCGPKDLQIGTLPVSFYEITKSTNMSGIGYVTASETVRFNIVDYCEDLYPKIRLSWLNDLGGRDYYNFTMFYEQSSNSIEKNYNQSTMNWNQATPVVIPGNSIDSSSNWRRGGNKSFNKNVVRRFTIQSDYLDQEKVDFLSAVPESPSVWAYIGTQSVPYTVTVTNTEYTNKYVKQQKLVQVSFDCTLTKTQQKQNS